MTFEILCYKTDKKMLFVVNNILHSVPSCVGGFLSKDGKYINFDVRYRIPYLIKLYKEKYRENYKPFDNQDNLKINTKQEGIFAGKFPVLTHEIIGIYNRQSLQYLEQIYKEMIYGRKGRPIST